MNNLKNKLKKRGGFTLVEMLIVVAIIAILIAVSIPMVSSSLERAREAVDKANARSAVGLAAIKVLSADPQDPIADGTVWSYVINGNQGHLVDGDGSGVEAQCKALNNAKLAVTYHAGSGADDEYFTTTYDTLTVGGGGENP